MVAFLTSVYFLFLLLFPQALLGNRENASVAVIQAQLSANWGNRSLNSTLEMEALPRASCR